MGPAIRVRRVPRVRFVLRYIYNNIIVNLNTIRLINRVICSNSSMTCLIYMLHDAINLFNKYVCVMLNK